MFHFRAKSFGWTFLFFFHLLLLSGTSKAFAKEYDLFVIGPDGLSHPVSNYDSIVGSLHKGDVIRFAGGESFKLVQDLHDGRGSMSRIFSVQDPKRVALRFPQYSNPLFLEMISRSIDGYDALKEAGVPTVSIQASRRRQYLLVDQVKSNLITAEELFRQPNRVSRTMKNKMVDQLVEFAKATAYFKHIGDFGLSQIVYDAQTERWILLDWTAGHESIAPQKTSSDSKNSFEHVFEKVLKEQNASQKRWIAAVQNKINHAIQEQRTEIRSHTILLERLRLIEEKISTRTALPSIQLGHAGFMNCLISGMHHSIEF